MAMTPRKVRGDAERIKESLLRKRIKIPRAPDQFLSTGSTLLNLACTGNPSGGFLKGHYFFLVGDSVSGKTFLSLTCLAEAAKNPVFQDYRFIHDNVEGGALMDLKRFFGQSVVERLEPPEIKAGHPVCSHTVEEFYYHLDDAFKVKKPFIYVLDSQDSLSSEAEGAKFTEHKDAHRKGRDTAGSYGDNKAKTHSGNIRKLLGPLQDTGSILLVLNQTRDSFDLFEKSTYSGGRALRFYATLQMWSSQAGQIKREYRGKSRQLGINCRIRIRKNRITGREPTVTIPIYHSVGIDDVGSCVDYLVDEKVWKKDRAGVIEVTGLGPAFEKRREALIQQIEEGEMEDDLRMMVAETWQEIEKACEVKRKARYE